MQKYRFILIYLCTCLIFHSAQAQRKKTVLIPRILFYLDPTIKVKSIILYHDERAFKEIGNDKTAMPAGLSAYEIKIIEKLISRKVHEYNAKLPTNYKHIVKPEKYFKEFVASINAKEEKKVIAYCHCTVIEDAWKKGKRSITSDGGTCEFTVLINLTKKMVEKLYVAGLG